MNQDPVLIDTSAWIEYFRKSDTMIANLVEGLIELERAAIIWPIAVEVLSGVKGKNSYARIASYFSELRNFSIFEDGIWEKSSQVRFLLQRKGVNSSVVDVLIASSASYYDIPLLTKDNDFFAIQKELPLKLVRVVKEA